MEIEKKLETLNKIRRKTEMQLVVFYIMVIVLGILIMSMQRIPQLLIFIIFICATIIGVGHKIIAKGYRSQFKRTIMPLALSEFSDQMTYSELGLEKDDAQRTGMFGRFSTFKSEDLIEGELFKVNFKCSDVKLGYYTGGKHRRYVPVCHGQLYIFDFNKRFKTKIIMREKNSFAPSGLDRIKLESEQFNQQFNVFSDNQHECFYILTPHFMEKLLVLERKHPGTLFLSFYNNQLHIGIHNNKNRFEPPLFADVSRETINQQLSDLLIIKEIIEALKLNVRIFI